MENYITKQEHDAFAKLMNLENQRLADENSRQNSRINALETAAQQINTLALSVERLAASVEAMTKEQLKINKSLEKQGERIGSLEGQDGEMWRKVTGHLVTAVVGIVVGYIFTQIGM